MTAEPRSSPGILFLGCGISAAVPQLRHLLNASKCKQNPRPQRELMSQTAAGPWDSTAFLNFKNVILTEDMECRVCLEASQNPLSKNRRNNISLVLCVPGSGTQRSATGADNAAADTEGGGEFQYVLVDIGKTFRESAVRHFLPNRIPRIDALIISHSHEDAAGGLDEVREFQSFEQVQVAEGHMLYRPRRPLPVYLGQACLRDLRKRFSYICMYTAHATQYSSALLHSTVSALLHYTRVMQFSMSVVTCGRIASIQWRQCVWLLLSAFVSR
eukprot:Lankesteria_metandrocarpae@DN1812_c0_g1_i1.p1